MANLPLFLFTLLGGLAAGAYLAETCLDRKRTAADAWLVPAATLALVAVGAVAATFHVGNIARAFTLHVNLGSGMTQEILLVAVFGMLVLIDLVLCRTKGRSPFALRVCGAVVAATLMLSMGHAYATVLGNPVWAQPMATIPSFFAGSLLSGLLLFGLLRRSAMSNGGAKAYLGVSAALLAIALAVQSSVFAAWSANTASLVAGLVAVIAGTACAFISAKRAGTGLPAAAFALALAGVGLARWAFYTVSVL
jgi:DMSO reductase anchor subunit